MARQDEAQKATIGRVMHEFRHGELESHGRTVRDPRQALAIGLSEAGASRGQTPAQQRRNRARSTASAEADGRSRAELYAEAKRRGIPGRARMSKVALARALADRG